MTEEKSPDQGIPPESLSYIKTLFSRLTELIMSTCVSRKAVADSIIAIGQWVGVIYASLLIMIEVKPMESNIRADQISDALNKEIKKHLIVLRGLKNKSSGKEESRIVLPKGTTREGGIIS